MDLQQAEKQLTSELSPYYGDREATLISDWVMEHLTGRKKLERRLYSSEPLSATGLDQYERYRVELLAHRPVQYVLGESWFGGMPFYVDENVLIPRPETEELVDWVAEAVQEHEGTTQSHNQGLAQEGARVCRLLDVGTGSGCIAISLARKFPAMEVHACDVSGAALAIAHRNAATLAADCRFHSLDFLDPGQWNTLPEVQWLVSNPPYIAASERSSMAAHVTASEPAIALFVPDNDPLLFYRALAEFARQRLLRDGSIFVEIHEDLASGTLDIFRTAGFRHVILRKDMQGKDRMIRASRAHER